MTSTCGNLFLVGAITLVAAGSVPSPFEYTVQYSALGILGWAVWYMLAKAFPRHLRAQQEEREVILKAHQEALDTILEVVKSSKLP